MSDKMTPGAVAIALALALSACAPGAIHTRSATPAAVELGASTDRPDQDLADAAQAHCAATGRSAALVGRSVGHTMPNLRDGRYLLFHCR